ncbi:MULTISPECIES: DUF488 domain-containing protein [Cytobacillus]|uniref:DUF488 domain-containing protein n=1 Tax=Cytobacillus TaxID=2675230 RepID=UPI002040286E|nr:DUF488 domain-containing protein [Cytobacillus firmus]MCM3706952.1 DUF488 domain-containing protein [Cytobacillus firmus]
MKRKARYRHGEKAASPRSEFRRAINHKSELSAKFQGKYLAELRSQEVKKRKTEELAKMAEKQNVTLLYSAKYPIHIHARVLCEEITRVMNV